MQFSWHNFYFLCFFVFLFHLNLYGILIMKMIFWCTFAITKKTFLLTAIGAFANMLSMIIKQSFRAIFFTKLTLILARMWRMTIMGYILWMLKCLITIVLAFLIERTSLLTFMVWLCAHVMTFVSSSTHTFYILTSCLTQFLALMICGARTHWPLRFLDLRISFI